MARISAVQAGGINLVHFLDLVAWSEGTSTEDITKDDGYDVIVTADVLGPNGRYQAHEETFDSYVDHPFAFGRPAVLVRPGPPPLTSTASGRYQLLLRYWQAYKAMLHLPDFSPVSQDLVALRQIKERGAISSILAGTIDQAIYDCSGIWASFPGNQYAQGGKSLSVLQDKWEALCIA